MFRCIVAGAFVAAATASAGTPPGEKVVAFHAVVRVDVGASGEPVSVQAPEALPAVVRKALEERVADWGYEPATRDGVAVESTTYVSVGVCAAPQGDGIRLGVDFKGNGPRLLTPMSRLAPPPYPDEAVRAHAQGSFTVNYAVLPDGSTRVVSVEATDGGGLGGNRKAFEKALTDWATGLRYEPERVAGAPVATRQSVPVIFELSRRALRLPARRDPAASQECQAATGQGGLVPVALDSPVKVTPRPAS